MPTTGHYDNSIEFKRHLYVECISVAIGEKMSLENHIALTSSTVVDELCKPLKEFFKIEYFQFRRTFNDRSRIVLSNRPDFIRHYYEYKRYDAYGTFENTHSKIGLDTPVFGIDLEEHIESSAQKKVREELPTSDKHGIQSTFVLWSALEDDTVFKEIFADCKSFNIYNGITLAEEGTDHCTFYHFAAAADDLAAVTLFVQNIDLLKRFILYFKEQARDLIEDANKSRIIAPIEKSIVEPSKKTFSTFTPFSKKQFLKSTPLKKICIDERNNIQLNRKEAICACALVQGKNARQISEYLNLSKRTIEDMVVQLRSKFDANSKNELIEKLIKTDYAELFVKSSLMD
ncbi:MAG: LuxR C-terminal-related transcriptional regulator [Gammaproteobacteria bacterium]|nr:LuxR C-terminal-related transcriptional regulator [Gammaproteobacteria bacterium]